MYDNAHPTQELSVASSSNHTDDSDGCPVCGGPIQSVERRGPSEVSVEPCGHDITNVQAFALATPEQRQVATDGGSEMTVIDRTIEASEQFQNRDVGGVSFSGAAGFHSYFQQSEGLQFALHAALHGAVDEALEDIWLDAEIIENEHGELTPETAEEFLRNSLDRVYDLPRHHFLNRRLGEAFAERLADIEDSLAENEVSE